MASLDHKWWYAQLNLAWRVVVHFLAKLWPWRTRYGLARFQENYVGEDRLPPVRAADRLLTEQPGRCTTCGACDAACPILARRDASPEGFLGPMTFVLAGTRAAPHFVEVRATVTTLLSPTCNGCRACDAACPERIPIAALAAFVARQDEVIEAARGGALPITDTRAALPDHAREPRR